MYNILSYLEYICTQISLTVSGYLINMGYYLWNKLALRWLAYFNNLPVSIGKCGEQKLIRCCYNPQMFLLL